MLANFIFLTVMTISIVEDVTTLSDLHNIGHHRGCTEGTTHVMRAPTAGFPLSLSCTGPVGKQYQHIHLFTIHLSSPCFIRVGLYIPCIDECERRKTGFSPFTFVGTCCLHPFLDGRFVIVSPRESAGVCARRVRQRMMWSRSRRSQPILCAPGSDLDVSLFFSPLRAVDDVSTDPRIFDIMHALIP